MTLQNISRFITIPLVLALTLSASSQANVELAKQGWYADPEIHLFAGQYWIYPTSSPSTAAPEASQETYTPSQTSLRSNHIVHKSYLLQTSLDAFSSPDLVHWTRHKDILDIKIIPWAAYAIWAPSAIQLNGRYYLFF